MKEQLFVEVIKVKNGEFVNPQPHMERIYRTTLHFFSKPLSVEFNNITIPTDLHSHRLVKCRIVYGRSIVSINFEPYKVRNIKRLSIVEHNTIDYKYKYLNRDLINKLIVSHSDSDDILIVKNSKVTDTSFTNVVFRDTMGKLYTPKSPLLAGIKRQHLLDNGIIHEKDIHVNNITLYEGVYLINAMIDLEDEVFIKVGSIV